MRELHDVRPQRVLEAEAEELGGMVVADDARHRLGDLADAGVGRGERRPHLVGDRARRLLERVQQHADGRDRLADVVVQLARDALALGFERLQHALREALAGGLELLALADVAHDAEHVGRRRRRRCARR